MIIDYCEVLEAFERKHGTYDEIMDDKYPYDDENGNINAAAKNQNIRRLLHAHDIAVARAVGFMMGMQYHKTYGDYRDTWEMLIWNLRNNRYFY